MISKTRSPGRFPHLEYLLAHGGSYLIGDTKSIQGVAIASDVEVVYAALMREEGESLDALHRRLDGVVGEVMRGEIEPINEVPGGRLYVGRKRREAGKP
ncbi:MAG: hypothetical protein ACREFT_05280 [Acetobacteraceae bacterium]